MGWGNIAEAATACGVPANSWRNWERDNRTPMRVTQIATLIARRTGCDKYWLITGERQAHDATTLQSHPLTERPGWIPTEADKPHDRPPNRRPVPGEFGPSMVRPGRVPRFAAR